MLELIGLAMAAGAAVVGFVATRGFVRERLRFVDAVQGRAAPWLAGVAAGLVALPIVALIPLVSVGTAIIFGASVGAGVAIGARDIRQGTTTAYLSSGEN